MLNPRSSILDPKKMPRKRPEELRSHRWYGAQDLRAFGHRSRTLQIGFTREDFAGKPVIAIINTWSDINQCHSHFRQRAEEVKRGVWQAGGFPLEMPAITLSEPFMKPSPHDVPQPAGDGDRGTAALVPGRWRGADGRLRQDHAGADHGRDLRQPAGDLHAGWADAARQLARRAAGLRHRHLEILGGIARRQHQRLRTGRKSKRASRARPATA